MKKNYKRGYRLATTEAVDKHPTTTLWLDKYDVMTKLNISERTLQKWRKEKLITYYQVGRRIWYSPESINELMEQHARKKTLV